MSGGGLAVMSSRYTKLSTLGTRASANTQSSSAWDQHAQVYLLNSTIRCALCARPRDSQHLAIYDTWM
ncbi:hypothetical protein KEM54_005218 [Ascosphaera aggregata]|nr:hypothetical protein KEM54_005218 [Ascosphaera aggregata]